MDNIDNLFEKEPVIDEKVLYDDVIKWFDEKIKLNPKDYEAWYYKGCILSRALSLDSAIECYNEAIKIKPENFQIWIKKGEALFDMYVSIENKNECFDEIIECFDEAIKLNPNNYEAWYLKGQAFESKGVYEEKIECFHDAIKCFDKAITLNPNDYASYFCRAYSKCELQDYAGAIEDCCKSIEINPNNLHVYEKCIEAYKLSGDYENARKMERQLPPPL